MDLIKVFVAILGFCGVKSYPFSEGDIRLVGGSNKNEGTVLIFHDNKWGSICDYNWDIRDAHVACRQLGYPRALQYIHGSRFGRGRRRVWLTDVYCRGNEESLSECYNPGWGTLYRRHQHACRGHKNSAGVVCLNIETAAPTTLPTTKTDEKENEENAEVLESPSEFDNILLGDEANQIPLDSRSEEESELEITPEKQTIKSTPQPTPPTKKPTTTTEKLTTTKKPITTTTKLTTTKPTTTKQPITTTTKLTTSKPTTTKKPMTTTTKLTTTKPMTTTPTTTLPTTETADMQNDESLEVIDSQPEFKTTTVFDVAAQLPRMRVGSWTMDKDIERWVLPLRDGKYLVAIPGRSPTKVTKEDYIKIRREVIKPPTTTAASFVFVSQEILQQNDDGDDDDADDDDEPEEQNDQIVERMKADDPAIVLEDSNSEQSANLEISTNKDDKLKEKTKDEIDEEVKEMLTEKDNDDDSSNKSFNVQQGGPGKSATNKPTTSPTSKTTTTQTPKTTTTQKPKTTTTPTPKPTTTTTLKPTTTTTPIQTTTTTPKPSTTTPKPNSRAPAESTTIKTTTSSNRSVRETTIYDRASMLPDLVVNTWVMDRDVVLWVLKLRNNEFMVSNPGQQPQRMTRDEYINMRRQKLQAQTTTTTTTRRPSQQQRGQPSNLQTNRHDEMKSDDPSAGNTINLDNRQSDSLGTLAEGGNSAQERSQNERIGTNIIDTVINGGSHTHRHRHGNEAHRYRHKRVQIKLSGGRNNLDGRLEVLPPGQDDWGVICGDNWSLKEAIVACRHFDKGYAMQAAKTSFYGGKYQKKYYSAVHCIGTEKSLDECRWEDHNGLIQCTRSDAVAAIVCSRTLADLEPSTYMVETSAFLQDRHLYYLQCAMEENCLAQSAYELQKTSSRWRTSTRRLLRFSSVVKNIGTADFKPKSGRSDWEWHACHMHYHSMEVFAHYDIVDLNGNRVAEGLKASFCLEDSACDRGIHPKFDCQHYGEQGISVGCSDNYMADIDCQWIDITDLKPGNFRFKLEVNPSLLVPEISFENNGMSCDLQYTGYYARMTNCKLQSIL